MRPTPDVPTRVGNRVNKSHDPNKGQFALDVFNSSVFLGSSPTRDIVKFVQVRYVASAGSDSTNFPSSGFPSPFDEDVIASFPSFLPEK
jgi:hypothetical protein